MLLKQEYHDYFGNAFDQNAVVIECDIIKKGHYCQRFKKY